LAREGEFGGAEGGDSAGVRGGEGFPEGGRGGEGGCEGGGGLLLVFHFLRVWLRRSGGGGDVGGEEGRS